MSEKPAMRCALEDLYRQSAVELLVAVGFTKESLDFPTMLAIERWIDRHVSSVEEQLASGAAPDAAVTKPDLSSIVPAGRA